jgi:hypothetical protein
MSEPRVANVIDRYVPTYDVRSRHEIEVHAPAAVTYRALRDLDVGRSIPVMVLFAIRGLPHLFTGKARPSRSMKLDSFLTLGFAILEENAPYELAMGAVGRFWRPDSGMLPVAPEEFRTFDSPGYAKGLLAFTVEERQKTSLLATETRVTCTDPSARRKFLLYWRAIAPFSGLIRRLMLNEVKRNAERAAERGGYAKV